MQIKICNMHLRFSTARGRDLNLPFHNEIATVKTHSKSYQTLKQIKLIQTT